MSCIKGGLWLNGLERQIQALAPEYQQFIMSPVTTDPGILHNCTPNQSGKHHKILIDEDRIVTTLFVKQYY
ncbi:hypothetical protein E2C01_017409 [Portunus trituberculatus]|uniref:Uncharacterized protein n=1 Tax=Portunus trituberculatus TaxID=210409 RepID=A0A5B7DSD7_PORTR|nr:hypothetical protein [Portunus trituberculatus]